MGTALRGGQQPDTHAPADLGCVAIRDLPAGVEPFGFHGTADTG